jgi:phosphoglycolate phosphatase
MIPARPTAVVFDLDGTLVDSAPDIHAVGLRMLADLGRPPVTLAQAKSFVGNGAATFVARCLAATGPEPDAALRAEALRLFHAHYDADPAALSTVYPGVVGLLDALGAAGVPLGVCTNKPRRPADAVLAALGLAPHFAAVVGGDTLPVLKPDPAPLFLTLELLGADPAGALFVGDSETDAATAQAAGVPLALFTGGYRRGPVEAMAHAFAFDGHAALAARLAAA